MKYRDAFERDFGADDSPSNDKKAMDAFDRDFGEEEKPSAKKGKTTKTPDISFLDSYSDIPVPRDLTQEDLRPYGAGLARGGRNVGESIGNAELWSANKLGAVSDGAYGDVKDIRKNRLQGYQQEFGNNPLSKAGVMVGEAATALPLMAAGGHLLGAAAAAIPGVEGAIASVPNILANGVSGYGQGASYNALTGQDVNEGGVTGAIINTAIPGSMAAAKGIKNIFTGGGVNPEVAQLAKRAEELGIKVPAAQISNSPSVKWLDSILPSIPFSGHGAELANARSQFTKAVSNTFGEDTPSLTRDVMSSAKKRIGSMYEEVAQNTPEVKLNTNALDDIASRASQIVENPKRFIDHIDYIKSLADENGAISGKNWRDLMQSKSVLSGLSKDNSMNMREFANETRDVLRGDLSGSASPEVNQLLATANRQYKNLKTVEDLADKAGVSGEISPSLLMTKTNKAAKRYGAKGIDDLQTLGDIGQQFFKGMPQSGSPERLAAYGILSSLGGFGGALAHGNVGGALGAIGAPIASSLAGKVASKAINSAPYRNSLLRAAENRSIDPADTAVSDAIRKLISNNYIPASLTGGNNLIGSNGR